MGWCHVVRYQQETAFCPQRICARISMISNEAEFVYKCDQFYDPDDQAGLLWNDQHIAIGWPKVYKKTLSNKDKQNQDWETFEKNFNPQAFDNVYAL